MKSCNRKYTTAIIKLCWKKKCFSQPAQKVNGKRAKTKNK